MNSLVNLLLSLFSSLGLDHELRPNCRLLLSEIHQHPSPSENNLTTPTFSDGLYDPECDSDGLFKTKSCNNTEVCWCEDSAERNLQCEDLLETNWIHLEIKHKVIDISIHHSHLQHIIQEHYKMDPELNDTIKIKYDVDARLIVMETQKIIDDKILNLSGLMLSSKTDLKINQMKFVVEEEDLEIESVLLYYVKKKSTNILKKLTTVILTVTAVLILTTSAGFLILQFLIRGNKKIKYEKAQTSETEEI